MMVSAVFAWMNANCKDIFRFKFAKANQNVEYRFKLEGSRKLCHDDDDDDDDHHQASPIHLWTMANNYSLPSPTCRHRRR